MDAASPGYCFNISDAIDKHADTVYRVCFAYLKNRADAEDAFQEVFAKLLTAKPAFNDEQHIKAWLITVSINQCKNMLRSTWFRKTVPLKETLQAITNEEKRGIVEQVMQLPGKYREVIYLYYYEGYPISDIAKILKRNEGTIRTQLKRGREQLKVILTGGNEDNEEHYA